MTSEKARRLRRTAVVVGVLWLLHVLWQLFAMAWTYLFSFGLPFEGVVSYCFGLGYVLMEYVGVGWSGPCPVSDWRWQVGAGVLLVLTILPFLCRAKWLRRAMYGLLSAAHLASALYTIANMSGAIT